ncbi:MAG TPA: hypothetical protein VGC06_06310 [Actinomycetes bacterium]
MTENEAAIVFRCGGGTQLSVTRSTTGPRTPKRRHRGWSRICGPRWPSSGHAVSRRRTTTCPA